MTKSKRRTLYQPHVCIYYSTVLLMYNLSQLGSCNYEQLEVGFLERPSGSSLAAPKHFYLHCGALFYLYMQHRILIDSWAHTNSYENNLHRPH